MTAAEVTTPSRGADLLIERRRADQNSGLQILRRSAGIRAAMQTTAPDTKAIGP